MGPDLDGPYSQVCVLGARESGWQGAPKLAAPRMAAPPHSRAADAQPLPATP